MKVNYLIPKITTTAIIVSSEIFPESNLNAWTMHLIIMLQTPMTHVSSTYFMNLQTKTTSLLLHRFMAAWSKVCGREDFTVLSQKSPDVDMFAYLQVSKRETQTTSFPSSVAVWHYRKFQDSSLTSLNMH